MKKFFYAFMLLGAVMMAGCKGGNTPETDSTKLWPAGEDDSSLAGYINSSGKLVIVANYSWAAGFSCGWAYVQDGSDEMFIGSNGKRAKIPYADRYDRFFYYDRLTFTEDKLMGKISSDLSVVVRADYSDLGPTSDNGYCYFQEEGESRYGYMDKNGKKVIAPDFDGAESFANGIAVVSVIKNNEARYGVINTKGNYIIELGKKRLVNLGESRIASYSSTNEKWSMIDKSGDIITDGYNSILPFSCGLAMVGKGDKFGYINTKGDEVIDLRYAFASPFYDNVAWVRKNADADARYELIDKKGEQLCKLKEKEAPKGAFHNGLCLIYNVEKDEYRYIDKSGEMVYKWEAKGAKPVGDAPVNYAPQSEEALRLMLDTEYGPLFMDRLKEMSR